MTEPGKESAEGVKGEFVTCECSRECCLSKKGAGTRLGRHWASALTGFIAGVVVATIVLLPWLAFESRLEDSTRVPLNISSDGEALPDEGMTADDVPQGTEDGLMEEDSSADVAPDAMGVPSGESTAN